MTNFDGTERSAAISRDGRFVAYRSDREGPLDVWVTQIGTGQFFNVTKGIDDEFAVDTLSCGFSDGSEIWLSGGVGRRLRLLPLMGGTPRPFLPDSTVSVAWSPDGTRVVYHLQDKGDSVFVADRSGANARLIARASCRGPRATRSSDRSTKRKRAQSFSDLVRRRSLDLLREWHTGN